MVLLFMASMTRFVFLSLLEHDARCWPTGNAISKLSLISGRVGCDGGGVLVGVVHLHHGPVVPVLFLLLQLSVDPSRGCSVPLLQTSTRLKTLSTVKTIEKKTWFFSSSPL